MRKKHLLVRLLQALSLPPPAELEQPSLLLGKISTATEFVRLPFIFLSDPSISGVRSMGPGVSNCFFVDLTDVSPVDEDTKSILADDTNSAIPGN